VSETTERKQRPARRMFAATTLAMQAFVLFFATLVAHGLADVPRVWVWSVGMGLVALCLVTAGLLSKPWAYTLGWVIQGLTLIAAIWLPLLALIGVVFALIYLWGEISGKRIDRERKQRALDRLDSHDRSTD